MSIQPLPPSVIAQIKSATAITSLNGVICELMKNSLDAGSTKIDITVDYTRGACSVEDDGLGILPCEFREGGGVGKLHHTSKLGSENQLHGRRGTFLVSLSAMALVSITSHHHLHHSHNTLSMHNSRVVARQTPSPADHHLLYPSHGTRVSVRDLFGNMPVRVKQRAIAAEKFRGSNRDWGSLKWNLVMLLLCWPTNIALTIREVGTQQKMAIRLPSTREQSGSEPLARVSVSKVCNILFQASFITPDERSSWVRVTAHTDKIEVEGAISLSPSPTKNVQFISLGIRPVLASSSQTILHDEINQLFMNSAFGIEEDSYVLDDAERISRAKNVRHPAEVYTTRELKGNKKGVDRWPMFYINIHEAQHEPLDVDDILDSQGNALNLILELLQAMILEFLARNHFGSKVRRGNCSRSDSRDTLVKSYGNTSETTDGGGDGSSRLQPPTASNTRPGDKLVSRKKYSSSTYTFQHDPLGVHIKLPSFRRSPSQFASAFDEWPQIKQGTAHSRAPYNKCNSVSLPVSGQLKKVEDASRIVTPGLADEEQPLPPLVSSNGKITRRPFVDVETCKDPTPDTRSESPRHNNIVTLNDANDDTIVEWTNPISKVNSFINQRTGHTVLEKLKGVQSGPSCSTYTQGTAFSRDILKRYAATTTSGPSPWVSNILKNWDNPVYAPAEPSIPQVSVDGLGDATQDVLHGRHHRCSQIDIDRAFKDYSSSVDGCISKDALKSAKVISQVDRKFILVKLHALAIPANQERQTTKDGSMLAIIDQHAADERVRIEELMEEFCRESDPSSTNTSRSDVLTQVLEKPIVFEISPQEIRLLHTQRGHFARWGILYDLPKGEDAPRHQDKRNLTPTVMVRGLPPGIAARCRMDPAVLVDLIRTEAWKCSEKGITTNPSTSSFLSEGMSSSTPAWLHRIHNCPQGIIDMLNSRACRSAIMFNDELTREQCDGLVRKLAGCVFPFQCAHGRPSLAPLVGLGTLSVHGGLPGSSPGEHRDREGSFRSAFVDWKNNSGSDYRDDRL